MPSCKFPAFEASLAISGRPFCHVVHRCGAYHPGDTNIVRSIHLLDNTPSNVSSFNPFQRPFRYRLRQSDQVAVALRQCHSCIVGIQVASALLPHQTNTHASLTLVCNHPRLQDSVWILADPVDTSPQSGIDILKSSDSTPLPRVMLQSGLGRFPGDVGYLCFAAMPQLDNCSAVERVLVHYATPV